MMNERFCHSSDNVSLSAQRQAHPSTSATVSARDFRYWFKNRLLLLKKLIQCLSEHCGKSLNELKVFFWSRILVVVALVENVSKTIGLFH
jgi:hypothetical protein